MPQPEDIQPVIEAISDGASLRAACRERGIHVQSMSAYLNSTEEVAGQYARAKEMRGEHFQEKALQFALASATGDLFEGKAIKSDGARVALDAIKWAVGRMTGKDGGVVRVEHSLAQMSDAELDERLRRMGAAAAAPSTGSDGA